MKNRLALALSGLGALLLPACGGGGGGGSASLMIIEESSNGFGILLPHRVFEADADGLPTTTIVEIRNLDDLMDNVTFANPIFAPVFWPDVGAVLPNGESGNHFLFTRFRQPIDVDSVLDASTGAAVNNNLLGTITVVAVNPATGTTTPIPGQAFIGGFTYGSTPDPTNPTQLLLERWVGLDGNGKPVALDVVNPISGNITKPGLGFPGTESTIPFAGAQNLVSPNSFVFIPDADNSLLSHETYPTGVQVRMRMTREVKGTNGKKLLNEGVASSTVGPDTVPPEVSISGNVPNIIPGNGDVDVDPETNITVEFTEPVQIITIGDLADGTPPSTSAAIQLQFGPSTAVVTVPFSVRPFSVFDLTRFELIPAYNFPGAGPQTPGLSCGTFSQVDIVVNAGQFVDLNVTAPNTNTLAANTFFTTGEGPGLINSPVFPDAIYVARGGSNQGISVIDLNGFGGGTGDPTYDVANPILEGNTNFPNNPNVLLQGSLLCPPLAPGSCTIDGGSPGVFTLVTDSSLNTLVAGAPILETVGDMAMGHALDNSFNNALPFGCQSGGGNICAATGLKLIAIAAGGANTLAPLNQGIVPIKTVVGAENLVSWSPHPNPPPLMFPPLCVAPLIGGVEPTAVDVVIPILAGGKGMINLLSPGAFPQGQPEFGIPPGGLLSIEQNTWFQGPSPPQQNIAGCFTYMMRQQIGQFMYVIDRAASQVVVFNSNRFSVIDRITLSDPTSLAMSPNMDFLAVTNQNADTVQFIDVDPSSSSFHDVIKTVPVGNGPLGIAWESGNEDILVCNQAGGTISVISAFTLTVRKTLLNQLNQPFDIALTPRQFGFGFQRGVYFGFVLNGDDSVAIIESGPDGINGWGFDDVIGRLPFTFRNATAIQPDWTNLNSAFWITHQQALDANGDPMGAPFDGAVTNIALTSGVIGLIPLDPGPFINPQIRDLEFNVIASIGEGPQGLTGVPVDIAFDIQRNQTALTNYSTQFSAGTPLSINGKCIIKPLGAGFIATSVPQFMFLAVPNSIEGPGVVDVIDLSSGFLRHDTNVFQPGTQSIVVPGAIGLMDFLRQ